jgi:type I restriction enzyme S subunit
MSDLTGWKRSQLGKECSIEIGGTPSRDVAEYWDSTNELNTWVSIRDLNQKVIVRTAESITDSGVKHSNAKLQPAGTILLSFKLSIGRVAIAGCPLYTNEAIAGLRSDSLVHDYLYHGLQQWDLLQGVDQAIKGATLNKKKLKLIEFDFPLEKSEQAKIAEMLSTVDRAIEQTEALIAKQERIKTGLMQDLLTLGIDEHGNLRSESTHEFKDSPLGRIPQDWSATSFGKIFSDYGGHVQTGPFGSQLHSHEYVIEGIPVVMPQDIISGHINTADIAQISELKATALARHRMLPGDLIFARRGDLSKCAVIQQVQEGWICGTGCLLMRPPLKALSPRWTAEIYRFYTTQRQVSIHAVGSTMPNLNTEILTSLVVARSPLEEQQRIEERLRGTEDHERINRNQLNKLKLLKMGLMQDLLTGRKRVTPLLELEHAH